MLKKTKALVLILTLAMLMNACTAAGTKTQETTAASTTAASTTAASTTATAPATGSEPDVIDFMIGEQFSAPVTDNLKVIQIIEEKTNTKLNITNVPQADLPVKVQTALSSGSMPDVVEFWNYDQAAVYAKNGLLIAMDQYLDKYKNLATWWAKFPAIEKNTKFDDGKLYILPKIDTRAFLVHLTINDNWLKELNLKAPATLDEFHTVLTAFKTKYPDNVPFGVGQYTGAGGLINQICYAYDIIPGFNLYDNGEYTYGQYGRKENYRSALKYLAALYSEGLIDAQLFSISEDEVTKKVSNGQVGVFVSWEMYELYGPGGSFGTNYIPLAALKGPDGKSHDRGTAATGVPFYVTKGAENPEAIMRLFDYIYSDEGVKLMNWGILDDTYTVTDGKYAYTDKILKNELGPSTGRYAAGLCTPHFPCVALKESEYAAIMPLSQEREKMLVGVKYPDSPVLTGTPDENDKITKIMADIYKFDAESLPKFVKGEWNTDKDFDAYIDQLMKMKIEDAIAIKQTQFDRWNKR